MATDPNEYKDQFVILHSINPVPTTNSDNLADFPFRMRESQVLPQIYLEEKSRPVRPPCQLVREDKNPNPSDKTNLYVAIIIFSFVLLVSIGIIFALVTK